MEDFTQHFIDHKNNAPRSLHHTQFDWDLNLNLTTNSIEITISISPLIHSHKYLTTNSLLSSAFYNWIANLNSLALLNTLFQINTIYEHTIRRIMRNKDLDVCKMKSLEFLAWNLPNMMYL